MEQLTEQQWEQRRYEIAKDIMASFASSPETGFKESAWYASIALKWADDLISELRKEAAI